MKITVGHVLLVVGVGTYVFLGPLEGWEKTLLIVGDARNQVANKVPHMEFLRTAERKPKPVPALPEAPKPIPAEVPPAAPPIAVQDKLPDAEASGKEKNFSEVPLTPVPPVPAAAVDAAPPVPEEPAVEAPKKDPAPPPAVHRRRRSVAKTVAAPVTAEPVKKAVKKKSADNLVGTYVSLTLKTGNSVKGVLVERTATNYKIELPGMGAFDYPADTVKSVAAAE